MASPWVPVDSFCGQVFCGGAGPWISLKRCEAVLWLAWRGITTAREVRGGQWREWLGSGKLIWRLWIQLGICGHKKRRPVGWSPFSAGGAGNSSD
ncbi:hypothetical protein KB266_004252 [Escherichia coli]|uniref:hypothetical protein n=1 Tax=Escherichia coli TaxID=562 RepID=UPI0011EA3D1A|nr:hypothetical protein [Escherichia coli]EBG7473788.1 hypothetical protein [Salmonella enterica]EEC1051974.1 hypothetical protein [Salmonella enterica subsp. enterica]HAX5617972.1 hypothetical protein [Escherichia coli O157]EFG3934659.1 hypothetical protein [Escherichia coli]EFH4995912.1 hypothetical protein [Escherichia coli]